MTEFRALPEPEGCPDHVDWDALSPVAQHGLMQRLRQLGRIGNDETDRVVVSRLLRPARRGAAA